MKDNKILFQIHDCFIYRVPFLPFELNSEQLDAFNSDFEVYSDELFLEALLLASPTTYNEFLKSKENLFKEEQKNQKLKTTLYKYKTRMQTRTIPFGKFAGCGIGQWSNLESSIKLNGKILEIYDIDKHLLGILLEKLNNDQYIYSNVKYFPNNTIYLVGNQLRYYESATGEKYNYFRLISTEHNQFVTEIISQGERGLSMDQLANFLISKGVAAKSAYLYVNDLISSQILISELKIYVSGRPALETIEKILFRFQSMPEATRNNINLFKDILSTIHGKTSLNDKYKKMISSLGLFGIDSKNTNLFQVDCSLKSNVSYINDGIKDELKKVIYFLSNINQEEKNKNLERFKEQYFERYDYQFTPLLKVLDPEIGIGYEKNHEGLNSLLDDLHILKEDYISSASELTSVQKVILNKIAQCKDNIIHLKDTDFELNVDGHCHLPPTFYISFSIIDSVENKIQFKFAGGSSGANIIGRFTHNQNNYLELAKELTNYELEQFKDVIVAEIIHLPDNLTANVISRGRILKYEIPCFTNSNIDSEYQIQLADLYLKIVNGRLVLFSLKHKCEVVPRLSNMHNSSLDLLPIYKFLVDYGKSIFKMSSLNLNLGSLHEILNYIPRIEYSNTILQPACWNFSKENYINILEADINSVEREMKHFQEKWKIPNLIYLREVEDKVLYNLNSKISVELFIARIKFKESINVIEYIENSKTALVTDSSGKGYLNEIIAFVLNPNFNYQTSYFKNSWLIKSNVKNKFILGDQWIYLRIFCGVNTTEFILINSISVIIKNLLESSVINKWFFIRYNKPTNHIRLRLMLSDTKHLSEVINSLNRGIKELLEGEFVEKISFDTYFREIERYGRSIAITENYFCIESTFAIEVVKLIISSDDDAIRTIYSFWAVDDLLTIFNYSKDKKLELYSRLYKNYKTEFKIKKQQERIFDLKFRALRDRLNLTHILYAASPGESLLLILKNRRSELFKFYEFYTDKLLPENIEVLVSSYIHMLLNRIYLSKQRQSEMIILYFLMKHTKSDMSRK
ncbi:MAG: lantibiotic dehydratase [Bacteroidota bacterium]